jgi:hypothetical protein
MKKFTDMEAYWISPKGEVIPIQGGKTHIELILTDPKVFGLKHSKVEAIYESENEEMGTEGKARDKIVGSLIKKGWIRIRQYAGRLCYFSVDVNKMDKRVKNILRKFAGDMISIGYDHYDMQIDVNGVEVEYPIKQVADDILYTIDPLKRARYGCELLFFEDFEEYRGYKLEQKYKLYKDFRMSDY